MRSTTALCFTLTAIATIAAPTVASAQRIATDIELIPAKPPSKPKIDGPIIVIPIDPPKLPDGIVRRYAPMLAASVIGRETFLPLCGVADENDSPYDPIWYQRAWRCTGTDGEDCAWQSPVRPDEDEYWIKPVDYYQGHLQWPDDDVAYGTYSIKCRRNASSATSDTVLHNHIAGVIRTPAPYGPLRFLDSEYALLHGGFVEHIRPAYARANVRVRRNHAWRTDYDDDLIIAIQMLGDAGWVDVATQEVTTDWSYRTYTLEAMVPELNDVRVQLRGVWDRSNHMGSSLQFKYVRLFVEQCVPDISNPGQCLE